MQIGGLGFFNTIASGKSEKNVSSGGFAGLMASVLSGAKEANAVDSQGQAEKIVESLTNLADFLKTEDLLELEEGLKILDTIMSNPENILGKALSHLGISEADIKLFLHKWNGFHESETENFSEDELLASLVSVMTGIANLPKNELAVKLDAMDVQALKAIKLFDLMSKYADGHESKLATLKESLGNLGDTLKTLLKMNNGNFHTDYFQTRFTQLARELNLSNTKNMTVSEANVITDSGGTIKTDGQTGAVTYLPQMTRTEQLTLMLNSPERPVSAEQLMKQFESILSKSQFMNNGGTQKLFIKLFPEHLGSIRVELFQKDQTMMARIITTSGMAKETLESHINGLKQAFAAQNLSVDRIEVTQQQAQQERFLNRDSGHHERQPDSREQEKKEEKGDFNLSFEEALLNTEV